MATDTHMQEGAVREHVRGPATAPVHQGLVEVSMRTQMLARPMRWRQPMQIRSLTWRDSQRRSSVQNRYGKP